MRLYDRQGKPIEMPEFCRLLNDRDYKVVKYTELAATKVHPASRLSTVWLGVDHHFFGSPPLIFETMRLSQDENESLTFPDGEGEVTEQLRYATEEDARRTHELIEQQIAKVEA